MATARSFASPGRSSIRSGSARIATGLTLAAAPAGGFVLTDDYNPIDTLRADEALRWRALTAKNIGEQAIF